MDSHTTRVRRIVDAVRNKKATETTQTDNRRQRFLADFIKTTFPRYKGDQEYYRLMGDRTTKLANEIYRDNEKKTPRKIKWP